MRRVVYFIPRENKIVFWREGRGGRTYVRMHNKQVEKRACINKLSKPYKLCIIFGMTCYEFG